jgi:hypothetical protein
LHTGFYVVAYLVSTFVLSYGDGAYRSVSSVSLAPRDAVRVVDIRQGLEPPLAPPGVAEFNVCHGVDYEEKK